MLRLLCLFVVVCAAAPAARAQAPSPAQQPGSLGYGHDDKELETIRQPPPGANPDLVRALKEYQVRNLEDLHTMQRLLWEVRTEVAKNSPYVIPLQSIKKLEQIEKMSKTIRSRMRLH